MNQTAKQLIEEAADSDLLGKLIDEFQDVNRSIKALSEQLDYLIEILE